MRFRYVDENNDWTFGKGKQSYVKDNDAIMLNLKTRLQSFLNDCFFALDDGVDWFNILGQKSTDEIVSSVKKIIIQTGGVTQINDIDLYNDRTSRNTTLEYSINTQYSSNINAIQEILT